MNTVKELVDSINSLRSQESASTKDEVRVMRAMLNDPTFKVDVYGKSGIEGQYCPYEEVRNMTTIILKNATKISTSEASELAASYEFGKQEAAILVGLSKEYINTYLQTGRKLPLGGREKSNISIVGKMKKERPNNFPRKVGVDNNGKDIYETCGEGVIPEHGSIKVYSSCPEWLKNKK